MAHTHHCPQTLQRNHQHQDELPTAYTVTLLASAIYAYIFHMHVHNIHMCLLL